MRGINVIRNNPAIEFLVAYVRVHLEPLRERSERGASAVEWAVIAAIGVAAASVIGTVVYNKVKGQADCVKADGCNPNK